MAHLTKEFVTAGRAVFTLEVPASFKAEYEAKHRGVTVKPHYTFRVNFKKGEGKYKDTYFLQLLTGPDNTKSYSYLGLLNKDEGTVRLTAKSCRGEGSIEVLLIRRALHRVWRNEVDVLEKAGFKLHHEGHCGRCGRALTVPESIETGIGPECLKQMGGGNFPHLVAQDEVDAAEQRRQKAEEGCKDGACTLPLPRSGLTLDDEALERAIAESEAADAQDDEPDEPDPANEAEDRALRGIYSGNHDLFGRRGGYGPYGEGY